LVLSKKGETWVGRGNREKLLWALLLEEADSSLLPLWLLSCSAILIPKGCISSIGDLFESRRGGGFEIYINILYPSSCSVLVSWYHFCLIGRNFDLKVTLT
jgi:hypothetical protein